MSSNSSQSSDISCLAPFPSVREISCSTNFELIITVCVVTALLAPLAVAGNAFILAAIWRNPSLRTPSYVLLAGLAVTDFFTGLISQPFFIFSQVAAITGNRIMHCITGNITGTAGYYFSSLTGVVMTLIAVERWLHMSRRFVLTVRRVIILYIFSAVSLVLVLGTYFCRMYIWFIPAKLFSVFETLYYFGGALCIIVTAFAYFKVFQIIRRHYNQVQANSNAIDMQKFKNSVFTILYILAIFVLSYVPYLCCILVLLISQKWGTKSAYAATNICAAMLLSSPFNPLLHNWRVQEIRDDIRRIVRKLFCKQNQEES